MMMKMCVLSLGPDLLVLEVLCPSIFATLLPDIVKCGRYLHILKASVAEEVRDAQLGGTVGR